MNFESPRYTLVRYNRAEILDALVRAGFPSYALDIMAAIGVAESSWTNVIQKGEPYATTGWGTWQITPGDSVPQVATDMGLLDIDANASAAFVKFNEGGFYPWTTWVNGKFREYLGYGENPSDPVEPMASPTVTTAHGITFKKGSDDANESA
jgi:hypothetical protein